MAPSCTLATSDVAHPANAQISGVSRHCADTAGRSVRAQGDYQLIWTTMSKHMVDARVQTYFSGYTDGHGTDAGQVMLATQTYQ
ncbi:MAG: hypothetical protein PF446_09490 [Oleiagrimonas sp.]|nr:hypothetical protein [Oleiagrimonas sp.]